MVMLDDFCTSHRIEISFIHSLEENGLIETVAINQVLYFAQGSIFSNACYTGVIGIGDRIDLAGTNPKQERNQNRRPHFVEGIILRFHFSHFLVINSAH